jgi:hypothetical protein
MEKKRYPIFDEEEGIDMACEPVSAVEMQQRKTADSITVVNDWIDDLDWDRFPSHGPFSEEEAIARIDEFEEELKNGKIKWISSEQMWNKLYNRFPWLR